VVGKILRNATNTGSPYKTKPFLLLLSFLLAVAITVIAIATLLSPEIGLNEFLSRQYLEEDLHSFEEAAAQFEQNLLKLRSHVRTITAQIDALQEADPNTRLNANAAEELLEDATIIEGIIRFSGNRIEFLADLTTNKTFTSLSDVLQHRLGRYLESIGPSDRSIRVLAEHDFGIPGYFGTIMHLKGENGQGTILVFPVDYLEAIGRTAEDGAVNRSVIIFDERNLPIVSSLGSAARPVLDDVIDVGNLPSGISLFNVSEHFVLVSVSRLTGWKLVQIVSAVDYASKVSTVRNVVFGVLSILAVLLLALVVLLFWAGRSPITRLLRLAKDHQIDIQQGRSRADGVLNALIHLKDQNRRFESLLNQRHAVYKEFFFSALLKGTISENEDNRDAMRLLGIDFPYPRYMVLVYLSLDETEKQETSWSPILNIWNTHEGIVHCADAPKSNRTLTAILNMQYDSPVYEVLQSIVDGRRITVGCGEIVDNYGRIPHSFMQAQAALDYRFVLGRTGIIKFAELPFGNSDGYRYPADIIDRLPRSLVSSDPGLVREVFQDLNDFVHSNRIPLYMARSIASETISVVSATIHKLSDTSYKNLQTRIDGLSVTEFDTVDVLFERIAVLAGDVCKQSLENDHAAGEILAHRIDQYLAAGFANNNFSLETISEEFGMSTSSFSRFFKRQFGETFIHRVMRMKMERACTLLVTSDMAIVDVVHESGYSDISNFTRKFRRQMSMTPAEYRKRSRSDN
jgi:AraC-like DNA-binding protein